MDAGMPKALHYQRARFVTQLPAEYLYTPTHFWIAQRDDQVWRVGMTKFASRMLGEMVDFGFEAAPESTVASGQVLGWVEGFKAVADLLCIAEGTFLESNPDLERNAALVNQDPHGAGWLYSIRGIPDSTCVDAQGYVRILDRVIETLLGGK